MRELGLYLDKINYVECMSFVRMLVSNCANASAFVTANEEGEGFGGGSIYIA